MFCRGQYALWSHASNLSPIRFALSILINLCPNHSVELAFPTGFNVVVSPKIDENSLSNKLKTDFRIDRRNSSAPLFSDVVLLFVRAPIPLVFVPLRNRPRNI